MSYYHNVLIESTVQYSRVQVASICLSIFMLPGDARIRFNLKRTVLFFSSVRSLSRDNYHGYGDIIILWALKLCLLIDYLCGNSTRVYWKALLFFTIYYLPKELTLVIALRRILVLESYFRSVLRRCAFFHEGYLFSTLWLF